MPITWGAADFANGQDNRFQRLLEHSGVGYVPAAPKSHFEVRCSPISDLALQVSDEAMDLPRSQHEGARFSSWAAVWPPTVTEVDHPGRSLTGCGVTGPAQPQQAC